MSNFTKPPGIVELTDVTVFDAGCDLGFSARSMATPAALTTKAAGNWVLCPKPNPRANLRLFCIPYAGGLPSVFRDWPSHLPSGVEVCSIQAPGRGARLHEPPFERLCPLVESLAQALFPYLDRPFAFFGHSMGALISFEVARELRRKFGLQPVCLFVSGSRAPQLVASKRFTYTLPDQGFLEELRRLNGTPDKVLEQLEVMRLVLPLLRADFAVCETYVYTDEEPLNGSISAIGGIQDSDVTSDDLEAWRSQTAENFTLYLFRGDHFYFHSSRSVLLETLSEELHQLLLKIQCR